MFHADIMGQSVPFVKDNVSPDLILLCRHNRDMPVSPTHVSYQDQFRARLRALREAADYTQEQMAQMLAIEHETYKKYETRSMMPHYLIPTFALIVKRDIEYVMTGVKGSTVRTIPKRPQPPQPAKERPSKTA